MYIYTVDFVKKIVSPTAYYYVIKQFLVKKYSKKITWIIWNLKFIIRIADLKYVQMEYLIVQISNTHVVQNYRAATSHWQTPSHKVVLVSLLSSEIETNLLKCITCIYLTRINRKHQSINLTRISKSFFYVRFKFKLYIK